MMSKDNFTLFVGDLSLFCNVSHLKQAFSKFGEIRAVRIAFDETSQKQLHFGFVEFGSYEAALSALTAMNGTVLCGRILRVKWAINRNENVSEEARKAANFKLETSSVHVNFLSYQTTRLVSEELLRSIFSAFGEVKDVIIKKSTKENNTQRGYGFVHYSNTAEGIQSTLAAISNMYDVTIDNVNYTCAMSHACEQGFINSGGNPAFTSAVQSQSQSANSSYNSRQPSPSYFVPPPPHANAAGLARMTSDGYYVQTATGAFIPAYADPSSLPPNNNQYYVYTPNTGAPTAANYDSYQSPSYGYAESVPVSPNNMSNLPPPVYYGGQQHPVMPYTNAPQYSTHPSYDYLHPMMQQGAQSHPMHSGSFYQQPMQQQPMQQQQLPPTQPNRYRSMPQYSGRQPRPMLMGRCNSEPLVPRTAHYIGRQHHSAHDLSPSHSSSSPATPKI